MRNALIRILQAVIIVIAMSSFARAAWWFDNLTFHAPFDNVDAPLTLNVGTGTLSFTRTTTATYVHPTTGLITSAASGQLRIESNGALIEGQRTNSVIRSSEMDNTTAWTATDVTVSADQVVSPDGNTTSETLTATGANGSVLHSVTGTVASWTHSVYLKRKTGTGNVQVSADNTTWTTCTINSSTWTRCSDTRTLTVATYYSGVRLATSGDEVYAWGNQMEAGAFPSSYIPTTAAAVTRNADVLTFATSGNVSSTIGTASANADFLFIDGTYPRIFGGDGSNGRVIYRSGTSINAYDGTTVVTVTGFTVSANTPFAAATAWGTTQNIVVNGGTVYQGAFDGDKALGNQITGHTGYGHIKNLRIWNRAFTDAELKAITSDNQTFVAPAPANHNFLYFKKKAAGGGAAACTGYLLCQDFEGTGYDNVSGLGGTWVEDKAGGIVDPDNTVIVLAGSQSLYVEENSADVFTTGSFTAGSEIWGYFLFRMPSLPAVAAQTIMGFRDTGDVVRCAVRMQDNGAIYARHNTTDGAATVSTMSANTTYHVWPRYSAANDICTVGFSTDGVEPTSGDAFSSASLASAYSLDKIRFTSVHTDSKWAIDKVRVKDSAIGDNPQ